MRLIADCPADGASAALERARMQNWVEALADLPAWAIRRPWVSGEAPGVNPDFAPKPACFRQIVIDRMSTVHGCRRIDAPQGGAGITLVG